MRLMRVLTFIGLMIATASSFALGLGEIKVHSSLNEPFDASIPLSGADGMDESELLVKLASAGAFEAAGISRDSVLLELKFAVEVEGGSASIRISSNGPIREPFLNFILDIQSPKAQLMKEFTVLLDPQKP